VVMSVVGVALGGLAVIRLGLMRALIIGAFVGTLSNLSFAWLATQGHSLFALLVAIAMDNVAGGIAGTCLIAYMSSLTTVGFTATQYALFSSLYALPGKLLASQSGRIVESTARAADAGGPISALKGLFDRVPPESYATAMEKSQVTAAALGTGYMVFYLYSTAIGVFSIALSFMVAARQGDLPKPADEDEPASA
jgi:MFS transporter, PAT family, beta-lactamase induction signal transducer AmpG